MTKGHLTALQAEKRLSSLNYSQRTATPSALTEEPSDGSEPWQLRMKRKAAGPLVARASLHPAAFW